MTREEVARRFSSLGDKLKQVQSNQERLVAENAELKKRITLLEEELRDTSDKSRDLEKNYDRVRLAKTLVTTTADKAEMKFRVNELVREIDKCIALLNR